MVDIADLMEFDEQVRHRLEEIAEYDDNELLNAIPSTQVTEVKHAIAMTINLARKSKDLPLKKLPQGKLQEINDISKEVLALID